MPPQLTFDLQAAHKYFSATYFNRTWDYIVKAVRSGEEDDAMLACSMASLWHWMQREDHTVKNLSVGNWQVSRVYALRREAHNARRFGERALEYAKTLGVPFYLGYAYEALARAELIVQNTSQGMEYLRESRRFAEQVIEAEDKELLTKDLDALENQKSQIQNPK